MKRFFLAVFIGTFFLIGFAEARSAEPMQGCYIIEGTSLPAHLFCVDVDTLENIWLNWGEKDKPLPPEWVPIKSEIAILALFSERDFMMLTLEANARVLDGFLGMYSSNGDIIEMRRRPNGQSDLATQENGRVDRYVLGLPMEIPRVKSLPLTLQLR